MDKPGNVGWTLSYGIDFQAFKNLREPLILEKALEVYAPLRDEGQPVLLRLEAMRPPQGGCYEVVVSRKDTVLIRQALDEDGAPAKPPVNAWLWVHYDTIHSGLPSADMALRQVLGFLELRCA